MSATTTNITASLRALLSEVIDYAGMFPPASLSLPEAAEQYARHQTDAAAWMLARFVCSVQRLTELEQIRELPGRLSILGRAAESAAHFWIELETVQQTLREFKAGRGHQVDVELLEMPLPEEVTRGSDAEAEGFFRAVRERLAGWHLTAVLFELPLAESGPERLLMISRAIESAHTQLPRATTAPRLGLKLRFGGASVCPTAGQLGRFIAVCRDADVAWKATAGLHRPLHCVDTATGATTQGFLNILVAIVLAAVHRLRPEQIEEILNDQQAANFAFREEGLSWRDWRATTEQVQTVRDRAFISIGSCSFDEPRTGLRELGWL